ncbi:MAG: transcription termination factor NusA [Planctomycetales bacterium]|jgi:N utilization substance protein A|nr:transcription termination factor NusA [Planctomycetales bacterium]
MNGTEILRIVDAIHRDKAIDAEIVFEGIEQAILSAARKHFSEEEQLEVRIDRESGEPALICDGRMLDPELLGDLLGRISAQTAKQVMIQKIREAERDTLYEEYLELRSQLISGQVTRVDRGTVIVSLGKVEAILPRSEQIRKENYRTGDRVRAIVLDVRKAGSRVRVILSRTHADFVRRLFEVEIPEVNDRVIEVRSIAREAGNRSKVAVSCGDASIDCVGACVGVRGARIRGIVEELAGERIDIVRWNDSLSILVPNALQPAEVEDVILCPMLGKVIVLVREDQLSLAIGKFGQNVRLASKLVGWDINVMTQDLLDQQLDKSIEAFCVIPEVTAELAENLVSQGFFTFDDLSVIEPDQLAEIGGLSDEDCDKIVEYADRESQRLEAEEKIAAELKKQSAVQGEAPKPKVAPPVAEAAIQEPETVPPEVIVDSSAAVEE